MLATTPSSISLATGSWAAPMELAQMVMSRMPIRATSSITMLMI